MADGKKLFVYNATKRIARTFSEVKGKKLGEVVAIKDGALVVHGQGGFIEIARARPDGGRKGAAADAGVAVGAILGG
jgi:methionyl-tRNA formyltransferase